MTTVDGRCHCQRCQDRTGDIYRMIGKCWNCHADGILMLFRAGDRTAPLTCPVCGCDGKVNATRLATPDEIPEAAGTEQTAPIPLNDWQERAVKQWAADDRLWTTQETVEFNLRTFARTILATREQTAPAEPPLRRLIPPEWAEAANSARGLCESEANKWEHAAPKTAEHWRSVALRLGALYLTQDHLEATAWRSSSTAEPPDRLLTAARTVYDKFVRDEADGYRSSSRQYAIAILGKALEPAAGRSSSPTPQDTDQ